MTESEQRARVLALARQWIGLPYVDGARLRGECGDCTFLAVVYEDAGLIPPIEIEPYSPQAHLHRTGGRYLAIVRTFAVETTDPKPGDMVLYWFGRDYSHGAIIAERGWPHIIEANKAAGFIIEADGAQGHLALAKDRKFFTFVGARG